MPEWWETGYSGGPLVVVDGFPRPLYPPDAAQYGKPHSSDGPDVLAYKRTVARAGRWPWDPEGWDDSFSNAFSHGTDGGNVGKSGIAGVQRQQHIDATGWVGRQTFNTLRSIRVPDGKPHAGEMAMDAQAVALIDEAWALYGGTEPPPDQQGEVRLAALERAFTQLGVVESPPGTNRQKYGQWYGMDAVPWCAIFVSWCFEFGAADTGKDAPSFVKGARYAYCPYVVGDARAGRNGLSVTDDPIPGDLVVYDWHRDTVHDHIGIFERWVDSTSFQALEGNTSADQGGDQSNGGQVCRKVRLRVGQGTVFVRVAEPA